MTCTEIAKKYGIEKRAIDYFTKLGLVHPKAEQHGLNTFYDYSECEEEVARIAIVQAMDVRPMEKYVEILRILPKNEWDSFVINRIEENIKRMTMSAQLALELAKDMKEG